MTYSGPIATHFEQLKLLRIVELMLDGPETAGNTKVEEAGLVTPRQEIHGRG